MTTPFPFREYGEAGIRQLMYLSRFKSVCLLYDEISSPVKTAHREHDSADSKKAITRDFCAFQKSPAICPIESSAKGCKNDKKV
jgi:hypothetical protein